MREKIRCEKCNKVIGTIDKYALVMDGEFGNIGIMIFCSKCKKDTYEYEKGIGTNELIN